MSHRALRGTLWLSIGAAINRFLSVVKSGVLGRLLRPSDFGLMGVASILLRWTEMFSNPGVSQALIQKPGDVRSYLDSAFLIQIVRGLLLSLTVLVIAPAGAYFARTPEAIPVVRSVAVILLLRSWINPAVVYLQREMDFKREIRWRLAGSITGLAVAVVGGLIFRNVWSMVASLIAAQFMQVVASYLVVPYRPRLRVDFAQIGELLRFGRWIFLSHILMFFNQQADALFVGRFFGAYQLGLYQVGTTIAFAITSAIGTQVSGVALPAFARMKHVSEDGAMRSTSGAYLRLLRSLCLLLIPVSCGMTLFAEPLVSIVMGPRWAASAPIVRLMVWAGLGIALTNVTNGVLVGVGRPDIPMWISLGRLTTMLSLIFVFRNSGPTGIARGVMISALAAMAASLIMAFRIHGVDRAKAIRSMRQVLAAAFPLLLVQLTVGNSMPAVAVLGALLGLSIGLLLLFRILGRELMTGATASEASHSSVGGVHE